MCCIGYLSNKARGGVVYGHYNKAKAVLMHDATRSAWTQPLAMEYPLCALNPLAGLNSTTYGDRYINNHIKHS